MPRFNVSPVDLYGVREIPDPPGTVTADWLVTITNPDTGISYKDTLEGIATIISNFIGQGIVIPDRVYIPGVEMPTGSSVGTYVDGGITKGYIHDPYLVGKVYSVNRRGTELTIKGTEWDNDQPDREIRLLKDDGVSIGDVFGDGEVVIVQFQPQISPIISAPDAVARFSAGLLAISIDTTLTEAADRKLISMTVGCKVTFRADYPENVLCEIMHDGTTNKQGTIIAPAGQSISWFGEAATEIYIGRGERGQFVRIGSIWYPVNSELQQAWIKCLTFDPGRYQSPNQLLAIGGTILRVDYPRVFAKVLLLQALTPGAVAAPGSWALNPTLWGLGDGVNTLNVPQVDGTFTRYADFGAGWDVDRITSGVAQIPGHLQGMAVEIHNHDNGIANMILAYTGDGTVTSWDAATSTNQPDLRFANIMQDYGGSETRPINTNELPLLNI